MRKAIKIIIAVFATIIIVIAALGSIVFLDVAAYTATGSKTLTPTGTPIGKALVVYDPGLTGAAKGVADKVASDLQASGYTVTLAGIKSSAASNVTGNSIIVVGGPVYAGALTSSAKDYLDKLQPGEASQGNGPYYFYRVGVFGSGQGSTTPSDVSMLKNSVPALKDNGTLSNALVVKIGQSEDLNVRASDFVSQLTS